MGFIIPKVLLKKLYLKTGDKVEIHGVNSQIVVTKAKPKYTLDELLAKCDPSAPMPLELKQWDEAEPINNEVL